MVCPKGHGMIWIEGDRRGEGYWDCFKCRREKSGAMKSPEDKMIRSRDIVTKDYGKQKREDNELPGKA